jgi:hypothetical protein
MLTLLALMLGLAAGDQQAASGTYISADEIAATLKQSIANNTVDQPIKLAEVPGGHTKPRSRCCAAPRPRRPR